MRWRLIAPMCLVLGVLISLVARRSPQPDQDYSIYAHTIVKMKAGEGFYPAFVSSLPQPPRTTRSVRLPTSFLLLRIIPARLWFAVDALAWATALWLAAALSRRPQTAVVLAALWLALVARYGIALYQEIYGLPFAIWGLHEAEKGSDANAALLFGVASVFRELYAVSLLIGLVRRRRWPWLAMGATVTLIFLAHSIAAHPYLSPRGFEKPFGEEGYGVTYLVRFFSPLNNTRGIWPSIGFGFAASAFVVAGIAIWKERRIFVGAYVVMLAGATAWSLRYYWQVTYVPALVAAASNISWRRRDLRESLKGAEGEANAFMSDRKNPGGAPG